jgi:hypothetical protein
VPEFGSSHSDRPALDELAHTDLLLDALAQRQLADSPLGVKDPDDVALAALLEDWRDELRWPPASALVSPEQAVEALRTGLADRRRGRRGLAAIGSVAAALLVASGFGAVVVEARPGDALYGLHAMFFDQRRVNDDSIVLSAKADLAKVQQMIDEGQWDQAHNQLAEVSSTVESVNDGASRHDLEDQVNLLNTRVQTRDPNATLPPAAGPAPKGKPRNPPAASTTPPPPSQSASPSPSPSASPATTTPSAGRHRHHAPSPIPSSDVPSTTP